MFEDSLGYASPCLKKHTNKEKKKTIKTEQDKSKNKKW